MTSELAKEVLPARLRVLHKYTDDILAAADEIERLEADKAALVTAWGYERPDGTLEPYAIPTKRLAQLTRHECKVVRVGIIRIVPARRAKNRGPKMPKSIVYPRSKA